MANPTNLSYTNEHEWLRVDADVAVIGITAFAAEKLGDIVYVELPKPGTVVTAGTIVGEIESTKSVGELYTPVTGEVLEVNTEVEARPELVNNDPFGVGWLIRVRVENTGALLTVDEYNALTGE